MRQFSPFLSPRKGPGDSRLLDGHCGTGLIQCKGVRVDTYMYMYMYAVSVFNDSTTVFTTRNAFCLAKQLNVQVHGLSIFVHIRTVTLIELNLCEDVVQQFCTLLMCIV